jgi:putative membrane protein
MWMLPVICSVIAGTLGAGLIAMLPGLHVYNVMGLITLMLYGARETGVAVSPDLILSFMVGLVCGWSMLNTMSSVLLGAPDESAIFTVLPGQNYLMSGRGYEGVMMIGVGSLAGTLVLVLIAAPLAPVLMPLAQSVLMPHMHWILWVIITFILMSEWPKNGTHGPPGWHLFCDAWKGLAAGLLTFLLSGLLGFILLYRSPVSAEAAFQNIMPAFVGLFAIPWCLLNMVCGARLPEQRITQMLHIDADIILRSTAAGGLGGSFAAFFPVITGGVGGLLAGHATAQRDERVFMMSQGVSKMVYYAGALLLLFTPGLHLTRGGGAWLLKGLYEPQGRDDYLLVLGCIAISGALSFLLLSPLSRLMLWIMKRIDYRAVSAVALLCIVLMVWIVTGWAGVAVALTATGIGLIPVLFGSRRLNCLGLLLLPFACNLSGVGPALAKALGLL